MEELQRRRQAFKAEAGWHEGNRRKGMQHGTGLPVERLVVHTKITI